MQHALREYEKISNGALQFDLSKAGDLEITPDKPNSARRQTQVRHLGEVVGDLFVIAFQPEDGTGAEVPEKRELQHLNVSPPYPSKAGVVPRDKTGINSEALMTVVRHRIDDVHTGPEPFGGTYDLLGLVPQNLGPANVHNQLVRVAKIGELGHPEAAYGYADPVTTYTVGYRQGPDNRQERFGDPHAVFSPLPDYLQICAFLAITDKVAANLRASQRNPNFNILEYLNPEYSRPAT